MVAISHAHYEARVAEGALCQGLLREWIYSVSFELFVVGVGSSCLWTENPIPAMFQEVPAAPQLILCPQTGSTVSGISRDVNLLCSWLFLQSICRNRTGAPCTTCMFPKITGMFGISLRKSDCPHPQPRKCRNPYTANS